MFAGRFLDADDARHLRQAQHGLGLHVGDGAPGHVVEHHRDVDRLGDRLEVAVDAFLRRLVVVGHDRERAVGADLERRSARARSPRPWSCRRCRPSPATRPRGCSTATRMISQCSSTRDRRRFAGRADDADALRAFVDVPVDQAPQRVVVDAAVFVHRRDERDDAAGDGFHGRGPESVDSSDPGRVGPGACERMMARAARAGRLAHRGDALHESLGVAEETVFVGHDAQTRARRREVHRGRAESRAGPAGRRSRCRRRRSRRAGRRRRPTTPTIVGKSGRQR